MKILIISLAGVGDTVLGSPILKAIKEKYGGFDLLCFPYGIEKLYENYADNIYTFIDKKHTSTKKKPSTFSVIKTFFLLLKLKFKKYDLSISLHPSSSEKLGLVSSIIKAKRRIGFERKEYTDPVKLDTKLHRLERNFDLLKPLGIEVTDKKQFIPLTEENEKFAEEFLRNKGKLFVGIHPSGYWKTSFKHWGLENFAKLADLINQNFGAQILVFEGPSDEGDFNKMKELMDSEPILVKTDLKNAAAIVKKCSLFISNDTGLMHIAEAVETPLIDIGGWTEANAGPYLKTNKLFISDHLPCYKDCHVRKTGGKEGKNCNLECFKKIKVEEVFEVAKEYLK